jgi:hypothetical protein
METSATFASRQALRTVFSGEGASVMKRSLVMMITAVIVSFHAASAQPAVPAPMRSQPGAGAPAGEEMPLLSTMPVVEGGAAVPAQMAGFPLQVGDLRPGTIVVRLIRETFSNPVTDHPVELYVGSEAAPVEAKTNAEGRAEFTAIAVGSSVHAAATVDGQPLQSQVFQVPSRGGVRLMLVAGTGAAPAWAAPNAASPPIAPTPAGGTSLRITAVVGLLGAAGAFILVISRKRTSAAASASTPSPSSAVADLDALYARLIELEERRETGRIAERTFRVEREALRRRLEKLETMEPRQNA